MTRIQEIGAEMVKLQEELDAIREACTHPPIVLTKVHRADTGNYDPHADHYWTEFSCGLCGKHWIEDGSK